MRRRRTRRRNRTEAEEELLARLVALNRERAAEERRGVVRWLRPDYQVPKLGHKVRKPEEAEQVEADLTVTEPTDGKPAWPRDELDRIRIVREMLGRAPAPLAPEALSAAFRGRSSAQRRRRVEQVLQTLVAAGVAQQGIEGARRRQPLLHSALGSIPASAIDLSLHLDVVVTAPRLPAPDETAIGETVALVCGGKGGNQPVAASRHGARTAMPGWVGVAAGGARPGVRARR